MTGIETKLPQTGKTESKRSCVLVACDLGPAKRATIEGGLGFADHLGADPVILHVDPHPPLFVEGVSPIDPSDLTRMKREYRERALDELSGLVRAAGRGTESVEILVREGRPELRILETAQELNPEAIVLGAQVHGALEHLLVGRSALRVIREATAPVLTANVNAPWQGVEHILYAADLSEGVTRAESWAARIAGKTGALLSLVHVSQMGSDFAAPYVFPPRQMDALRETLVARLQGLKTRMTEAAKAFGPGAASVETHLIFAEDTARALAQTATRSKADLVVCGTHGRRGLARAFLGSVAEGLLRHSSTNVLTVREPAM